MIYGFAKQSGGRVRIYSEFGKGTTMRLYLLRHYGKAKEENTEPVETRALAEVTGRTILIVDDEPSVRMLASDVPTEYG